MRDSINLYLKNKSQKIGHYLLGICSLAFVSFVIMLIDEFLPINRLYLIIFYSFLLLLGVAALLYIKRYEKQREKFLKEISALESKETSLLNRNIIELGAFPKRKKENKQIKE